MNVSRSSRLKDVMKTPSGHDVIARLFYSLGLDEALIEETPLGPLKIGSLKKLSLVKIDDSAIDALLQLLNSMPEETNEEAGEISRAWWKEAVFYEIYPRSFCDSNGDGIGDIRGIIEKLDHIKSLGVDAIWCCPFYDSPNADNGYDIRDYKKIMKEFGTMEDVDQLIAECHRRDLKLIIDLVMNHSSVANEWFKTARDYLSELPEGAEPNAEECKYVDYYTFVKGQTSGNYYKTGKSDYYYEGQFSQQMPDLNLDNPNVRADFEDIAKFWLDLGVGGFRLDAAKEYFSGQPEKNVEVLTWFNNYVKSVNPDAYIVAETWTADYDRYLESGIESAFDFSYAGYDGNLAMTAHAGDPTYSGLYFAENLVKSQEKVSSYTENSMQAPFLSNHDLDRPASFLGYDENKVD